MAVASESSGLQLSLLDSAPASSSGGFGVNTASAFPSQDNTKSKSTDGPTAVTRHETYYIQSGDIVFQVEDTLFRVHRYFFERESGLFRDMLSLPTPSEANSSTDADKEKSALRQLEGTTDNNPINLPQVTSDDFTSFLWVFYNPTHYQYQAPIQTWVSILRLAHRWDFPSICALAFQELESAPPTMRLNLGDKYDAPTDWRMHAMMELVFRRKALTASEGEELGPSLVVRIAEMRENTRGGKDSLHERRLDYFYDHRNSYSPRRSRTPSPQPVAFEPLPHTVPPPVIIQPPIIIPPPPMAPPDLAPVPVYDPPPSTASSLDSENNGGTIKWHSRAKAMFRRLSRISFFT